MAKQPGLDFQSAKGGVGELKRRLLFVIGALIVFRIGSFIPIPGIDATVLAKLLEQQRGTIIEMFNMFSGGALSRASIFALGIMPYISASIIIQLLTVVHPALAEIKKEGEAGRRKNQPVYPLRHSGVGSISVNRYCYRFAEYAWNARSGN
ncbi:hypothetical protein OS42_39420 [Dickeya oryzae]